MRTCRECNGEQKEDLTCEWCAGTGSVGEVVYVEQLEAEIDMQGRIIKALQRQILREFQEK